MTFHDDLRWAVRYARRRPAFALAVVLTLAVSIAATTTAFGAADAVLWRALPFDRPDQLVFVWEAIDRDGQRSRSRVTAARFAAWRAVESGVASLSLFGAAGFTLDQADGRSTVRGVRVSASYFDTLGIRPLIGRTFSADEERPGNHRVVILAHHFWQEHFGSRGDVVGTTLRLSGEPYTIIGVMPPVAFPGWPSNPATITLDRDARQLWVPIQWTPDLAQSGRAHVYGAVARLADGVTAGAAAERLNQTVEPTAPDAHGAWVTPLREQMVSDARTPLVVLAAAAFAVLLIACANLASLYLSSFEARRAELSVRAALGAGVNRLVRQLTLETLLLVSGGAVLGVLLARAALSRVPALLPPSFPFLTAPSLDGAAIAFAAALAGLACVLIAGWPVARLVLTPSPRGMAARPRTTVYRVLVVSQIAAAFALAVAAALLGQSLRSIQRVDPGFSVERVFVARLGLPAGVAADPARIVADEQRVLASLRTRPGVEGVATAYDHPLAANWSETPVISGDNSRAEDRRQAELRIVSPGYFEVLGVDLLEGRTLTDRDALDAPGAALINEALARELGGRVLGRVIRSGTPRFTFGTAVPDEFTIVGVVRNERFRGLEAAVSPAFYLSTRQFPQTAVSLLVRTAGDPAAATADLRAAIRTVDPSITVDRPTSLEAISGEQLASRRLTTDLVSGFGFAALTLAALGLYGLLTVLVGGRTREIGVRLALGATPTAVARGVLRESLVNATLGVTLGALAAIVVGRLLESLLVGVTAYDSATIVVVAGALFSVAATAALIPARRAATVDPATVLRTE